MAYINYEHLYSKGLCDKDYHTLQKIFQKDFVLLEMEIKDPTKDFKKFLDLGLIQFLKKKEFTIKGVRISKKGLAFLKQLENLSYTDEIGELTDKLIDLYQTEDEVTNSKLKVLSNLSWFSSVTGFKSDTIYNTIEEYFCENKSKNKRVMHLDNLIWKAPSMYSNRKSLNNSVLFNLICKKHGLNLFTLIGKRNTELEWLLQVARLKPPRTKDSYLYFTNTFKGDTEHIERINNILKSKKIH